MANPYYSNADEGQRFQPGTTVKSNEVDGKLDEVQSGFDGAYEDTQRSIKLPAETGVSQEVVATALQRRSKVVGFDAEGKLSLVAGFTWRGNWAADTEYFVNDVVVTPSSGNWYIAQERHTSGATFSLSYWSLGLDYAAVRAILREEVGGLVEADLQPLVTAADESAQAAAQSETRAQEWAEKEGEVEPGQRSAKYWAGQSKNSALGDFALSDLNPAQWQTVTESTTLAANGWYAVDFTAGPMTLTLPADPVANDMIRLYKSAGNAIDSIIARNGQTIMGLTEGMTIDAEITSLDLVFNGADWRIV